MPPPCWYFAQHIANAAPTVTAGGLLQFTGQTEFQQAFPGLPKESFEESPKGADTYEHCADLVNSTSNQLPNCFMPGDILSGLSINSDPGHQVAVVGSACLSLMATPVAFGTTLAVDILSASIAARDSLPEVDVHQDLPRQPFPARGIT